MYAGKCLAIICKSTLTSNVGDKTIIIVLSFGAHETNRIPKFIIAEKSFI